MLEGSPGRDPSLHLYYRGLREGRFRILCSIFRILLFVFPFINDEDHAGNEDKCRSGAEA
jgi:hypothetical protein